MDPSRRSPGRLIAGLGGVSLFVALFMPWAGGGFDPETFDGWQLQLTTDQYLLITAAAAIGAALGVRADVGIPGLSMAAATAVLGTVAVILLVWLVVFEWPKVLPREFGQYVALIASIVVAAGGFMAVAAEVGGQRRSSRSAAPAYAVMAVGGVALFVTLFLTWFGGRDDGLSGWESLPLTDVLLVVTSVVALYAALARGVATMPGLSASGTAALLGAVATVLLAWFLLDFIEGPDRGIGAYVAPIAAAVIAVGGYWAARGEAGDKVSGPPSPP